MQPAAAPSTDSTTPIVFRMHGGARGAYYVVAVLLILLVITIPVSIWMFIRAGSAKLTIHPDRMVIRGFRTQTWQFSYLRRLGLLKVPVPAMGIGGAIARKKCGGKVAINLCSIDGMGGKEHFMVSQYERMDEIINRVVNKLGLPVEEVKMGAFGPKWPESVSG